MYHQSSGKHDSLASTVIGKHMNGKNNTGTTTKRQQQHELT